MWRNLTDEQRKRIEDAGTAPESLQGLESHPPHHNLFIEYFRDNCDDENDRRQWECYWWLKDQDLTTSRTSYNSELETKFETTYGPAGGSAIDWPPEVLTWFSTRKELEDAAKAVWDPKWGDLEGLPETPEYENYQVLNRQRIQWETDHPYPYPDIYSHCHKAVRNWYKAYFDEIARMHEVAMPYADLDLDYIDRLNKQNLDAMAEGARTSCIGYGHYVLIGEFPPGYVKAVTSYDKSWAGGLTMKARGGAFSLGKVEVVGCDDTDDQKWFKDAFRRVSKKAIAFE
jgi:hypothetical protein